MLICYRIKGVEKYALDNRLLFIRNENSLNEKYTMILQRFLNYRYLVFINTSNYTHPRMYS